MKTQVIQLNKNDDHISIRDKMGWSKVNRILLLLPVNGDYLRTKLELTLLKRHAVGLGAQLALVTKNLEIRFYAKHLGIPVFTSLHRAQSSHWRNDKRKMLEIHPLKSATELENIYKQVYHSPHSWMEHPITRIISFGIGILAISLLAIFILPGANIRLTPQMRTQTMDLEVTADPSLTTVNLSTGRIPAEVHDVVVEGMDSITTTGSVTVPDRFAYGGLQFTNITDHPITIPVGTIVTSLGRSPVRFITSVKDEVVLGKGKSVTLGSRSISPGTAGNLPANSLVAIESNLGLEAITTNPSPTIGGSDAAVPAPNMDDASLLQERLVAKLKQTALEDMQSSLPKGDVVIVPSLKLVDIIEKTTTPLVGEPGREFTLSMRLRFQSQVVTESSVNSLIEPILDANTPSGYSPIDSTVLWTYQSQPAIGEDGAAHWILTATRNIKAEIHVDEAVNQIKGLPVTLAIDRLNQLLPVSDQVQIKLSPRWWPRLPFLPMRILLSETES